MTADGFLRYKKKSDACVPFNAVANVTVCSSLTFVVLIDGGGAAAG